MLTINQRARVIRPSLLLIAFSLFACVITEAWANTVSTILCDIYDNVLINDLGPGIATMAIIALGISATFGKVSWGMAVSVGIGIVIFFGAPTVVQAFGLTPC